ncbi:hypothetical protein G6F50_016684 [Rhizopus delemar]|uniref:Uncharacterized protein n=1 Tax=Rhizopus delemar TaxID=936053 RepID=A0A9P7C1A5_9FUNG|nr:hypothetical protein G6F50_016684 [Rhizopus delemar]
MASRRALASKPSRRAASTFTPAHSTAWPDRSAVAPAATLAFTASSSRSSCFWRWPRARLFSTTSPALPPSSSAASARRASSAST